jgi:hypothetical protein
VGGLAFLSSTRLDQQNRTAQLLFQIFTRIATQVFPVNQFVSKLMANVFGEVSALRLSRKKLCVN